MRCIYSTSKMFTTSHPHRRHWSESMFPVTTCLVFGSVSFNFTSAGDNLIRLQYFFISVRWKEIWAKVQENYPIFCLSPFPFCTFPSPQFPLFFFKRFRISVRSVWTRYKASSGSIHPSISLLTIVNSATTSFYWRKKPGWSICTRFLRIQGNRKMTRIRGHHLTQTEPGRVAQSIYEEISTRTVFRTTKTYSKM